MVMAEAVTDPIGAAASKLPRKSGLKKTDIGLIPEDWDAIKLGLHVDIRSGESPSLFSFVSGGTPYFKVEQLNTGDKWLSKTPYSIRSDKSVPKGSVVFPKRGASILLNKVGIFARDSYMDTNLMALIPRGDIDGEFLYYALINVGLWKVADTTSIPQINNKHIIPLLIAAPLEKKEQEAIARVLADADEYIGSLEQLIQKKRLIKQGAMRDLLSGRNRLPGFSGEWDTVRLGEVCRMKSGDGITSTKIAKTGPFPCYGGNGLRGYTTEYTHDGQHPLIGRVGALCGNVLTVRGKFFASEHAIVVSTFDNVDVNWLAFTLDRLQLNKYSEASAQPVLTISKLQKIEIRIPPLIDEQRCVATILLEMNEELAVLQGKLEKARQIKQGMMQELLTGRVRLV